MSETAKIETQQLPNTSNKGPFLLMQKPNQHLMPKNPEFNLNPGLIQQTLSSIWSNTPEIQALFLDNPQYEYTTHSACLVTLKLDILLNPGQTVSLSLTSLAGTSNISNLDCFNIVLHQGTLQGITANKSEVYFHSSTTLCSFIGGNQSL